MKKLLLSLGLMASLVSAKDMTGKMGIGGNSTLGGVSGLNIAFQASKMLVVDATIGVDYFASGVSGVDAVTDWDLAAHGFLNFADFDNSNLLMGVGINLGGSTLEANEGLNMSIELPLRPVWYFNDHFAIFTQTGLLIDITQNHVKGAENNMRVKLGTQLVESAGVNFFF